MVELSVSQLLPPCCSCFHPMSSCLQQWLGVLWWCWLGSPQSAGADAGALVRVIARGLMETPLFIHVYTRGCWIYSLLAISETPSLTYHLLYMRIPQYRIHSCEVLSTPHSHLYSGSFVEFCSHVVTGH